jgi:hypothetical protein
MFEDFILIQAKVWVIFMISHVQGLQHLLMYTSRNGSVSTIKELRLNLGGNFICLCRARRLKLQWAHVQDRNLHSFVVVSSPLKHVQILLSTTQTIPCTIYTSTKESVGEKFLSPASLVLLASAAILIACYYNNRFCDEAYTLEYYCNIRFCGEVYTLELLQYSVLWGSLYT